jgi:small-conductance mechanosensitive channel
MRALQYLSDLYNYNTLREWMTATIVAVVVFVVGIALRGLLVKRVGAIAARTTTHVDDMAVELIAKTRAWVIAVFALMSGVAQLTLPPRVELVLGPFGKLVFLWQTALWGAAAIAFWVKHYSMNRTASNDRASVTMISAMGVAAKVLLWTLIVLGALEWSFGLHVTTLITGLGIGGIAIALAVQNILGDVLASLSIVFDKPFDVGDSIGVGDVTGVVEHIGLKTTRVRSVTGEQVIIGNADLLKSRLHNFKRMYQRRVVFRLEVAFDTPPDALQRLPSIVEQIITAQSPVRFDRCHVASFGDSSIRIEAVYFVLDPDYKRYMDVQQAINLEVIRRFASENVQFALPTRTVIHQGPMATKLAVTSAEPRGPDSKTAGQLIGWTAGRLLPSKPSSRQAVVRPSSRPAVPHQSPPDSSARRERSLPPAQATTLRRDRDTRRRRAIPGGGAPREFPECSRRSHWRRRTPPRWRR